MSLEVLEKNLAIRKRLAKQMAEKATDATKVNTEEQSPRSSANWSTFRHRKPGQLPPDREFALDKTMRWVGVGGLMPPTSLTAKFTTFPTRTKGT